MAESLFETLLNLGGGFIPLEVKIQKKKIFHHLNPLERINYFLLLPKMLDSTSRDESVNHMVLLFPLFWKDINMHITVLDEKCNHKRLFHHLCSGVHRMHKVLYSKALWVSPDGHTEELFSQ